MRAILTWKKHGEVVVEEVEMIPEGHPLYRPVEGIGVVELPITTTDLFDANKNKVFFEDDNGIFGLNPDQIVSVEVIGRNIYNAYNENPTNQGALMEIVKKTLNRTKKFVVDHKVAIAVTATVLTMVQVNKVARVNVDNFLSEKGLLDEFYSPAE